MKTTNFFHDLRNDLRYGLRVLGRAPAFSILAILTLGIGIGINTSLFSVVNAVLFEELPVRNPANLKRIEWNYRTRPGFRNPGTSELSYPTYEYLKARTTSFDDLICMTSGPSVTAPTINISRPGSTEVATAQFVSENYFDVIGAEFALGRGFSVGAGDDRAAGVLTYGAWQRLFGGDPGVLGRSLVARDASFKIIGVTSKSFYFDSNNDRQGRDLILPIAQYPAATGIADGLTQAKTPCTVVGRLRPGVSDERARAETEVLLQQAFLANSFKGLSAERFQTLDQRARLIAEMPPQVGLRGMARLIDSLTWRDVRADILPAALAGMLLPWVILLIPCLNVASLLLARASARQVEISTRLAMGASRYRLVRLLLTESILLASLGGVFGTAICVVAGRFLAALGVPFLLDLRVLALTAAISIVTGILFGLAPAVHSSRMDLMLAMKNGPLATPGGTRLRTNKGLITAQVALSALALVGAGLQLRSLLVSSSAAIEPEQVLVLQVGLNPNQAEAVDSSIYWREAVRLMDGLPGVVSTSLATEDRASNSGRIHVVGVGPRYFETMRIPLILGRDVDWNDRQGAESVAIVNQAYVREFHRDQNPVGQVVSTGMGRIAGVVADSSNAAGEGIVRGQGIQPTIYLPVLQQNSRSMAFVLRVAGNTTPLLGFIRRVAVELDPNATVGEMQTQAQLINSLLRPRRTVVTVFLVFGLVALFQASLGIYGMLSYFVSRKVPEIGVRMALGAASSQVTGWVLRQSLVPVGLGILLGILGLPAVAFAMRSVGDDSLGNIVVNDPVATLAALTPLAAVATLAALGPSWRASRINPMAALRSE